MTENNPAISPHAMKNVITPSGATRERTAQRQEADHEATPPHPRPQTRPEAGRSSWVARAMGDPRSRGPEQPLAGLELGLDLREDPLAPRPVIDVPGSSSRACSTLLGRFREDPGPSPASLASPGATRETPDQVLDLPDVGDTEKTVRAALCAKNDAAPIHRDIGSDGPTSARTERPESDRILAGRSAPPRPGIGRGHRIARSHDRRQRDLVDRQKGGRLIEASIGHQNPPIRMAMLKPKNQVRSGSRKKAKPSTKVSNVAEFPFVEATMRPPTLRRTTAAIEALSRMPLSPGLCGGDNVKHVEAPVEQSIFKPGDRVRASIRRIAP